MHQRRTATAAGIALAAALALAAPAAAGAPAQLAPLLGFEVTRLQFSVAPVPTAVAAKAQPGTTFVYTLSAPATVSFAIERALPGRVTRSGCVRIPTESTLLPPPGPPKPPPPFNKHPQFHRCHVFEPVAVLTRGGVAGRNAIPFSGQIADQQLRPDVYRATAVATAAATGAASPPRRQLFTVVTSSQVEFQQ